MSHTDHYKRLVKELESIFKECDQPNWDGYDAHSITRESVDQAKTFLAYLPLQYLQTVSLSPTNDGAMCFDWQNEHGSLSMEVHRNTIVYAVVRSEVHREYGTVPTFTEALSVIRRHSVIL